MDSKEYLGHWLGVTSKALARKMNARISRFGLTIQQYGALNKLYAEDRLTSHELASRLFTDSSSIMSLVDQLENKGLIKREPGKSDRRLKHLALTKKARAIEEELLNEINAANRELMERITEDEKSQMISCFKKILDFALDREDSVIPNNKEK